MKTSYDLTNCISNPMFKTNVFKFIDLMKIIKRAV